MGAPPLQLSHGLQAQPLFAFRKCQKKKKSKPIRKPNFLSLGRVCVIHCTCSLKQTTPSEEVNRKQLLSPHRLSTDHSEEHFQRQRAVSAVSIITSAMEGRMLL